MVDLVNVDLEDIDFEDLYVRKVLLSSPPPMPSALAGPSSGIAVKSMHGGADIGIECSDIASCVVGCREGGGAVRARQSRVR